MSHTTPSRRSRGFFVAGLLAIVVSAIAPAYADATYFELSNGNFSQDWSNTGQITTNDNWSGVPSIIGYLGQDITTVTATDPQTLTGTSASASDLDVIANQSSTSLTSGGVAEFEIANPTIALQGSGTADAPYIQLHLNTTGRTNVVVSYTLRDIDGTTDNSVQPVALQYRVGTSGNFINLPAGFIGDASTGPSFATFTANVSVTLPAAAENQPQVQVRIMTTNAIGNDEWIGIDDISVTSSGGGGAVAPSITTPPASQTVTEGANVTFSVVASGTAPLSYQWRKGTTDLANGGIFSGATTDTLTLTGVALSDAGNYNVVVTNSVNSATSNDAVLTVNPILVAPSITTQPSPQSVAMGGTATFTVVAAGTAPLSYQWKKGANNLSDAGNISGSQTATLTITGVSVSDLDSYSVVVSNGVNPPATSNAVALTLVSIVSPTGQLSYTGGTYAQNFDTLPSSGTFTLTSNGPLSFTAAPINASGLGGWSFANYAGSGTAALFRVDAGGSTSGSVYSYGTGTASDRSLGSLSSGTTISRFGAALVNNTGLPITALTLSYIGEQWRYGGPTNHSVNKLSFEYGVGATDINSSTFTAAPALDFTEPVSAGASATALDGNAPANRVAVSGTITGLNWGPGQTLILRWTDVNDSGSDDGLAIDDLAFSTPVAEADIIPAVAWVAPADNAVNVPVNASVSVTFNEAVNVTGSWFSLVGSLSGAHTATTSGGLTSYMLTPDVPFAEGETVTISVFAAQVTDAATGTRHPSADVFSSFITFSSGPLPIHTVQGAGNTSPYAGTQATVQGVVVASFQGAGQIGGYYVEAPDGQHDANTATSEGIYVFDNANVVAVGDLVTVSGTVTEFGTAPNSETEMSALTAFTKQSTGNPLPVATPVSLPFPNSGYAERYEGMLVTFPDALTVTDNYDYGHFGELILSNGRLSTPTNIVGPGAAAQEQEAKNLLNQILLDDGSSISYPDPTPFLSSADPATATRRAGSTTTGVTGILDNRFGTYVIEPTATPTFVDANPRGAAPSPSGRLHIAIGNVLNFFNGNGSGLDGTDGGFPTVRGATNLAEYQRQRAKMIAGITAIAPDIMGLTEVENDSAADGSATSYGPTSAIADIVNGLNAAAPAGTTYAFVDASAVEITTDVIHVAFIYRTETVETVGVPKMLNNAAFNNLARNPLAQTFREKSTGEKLTVCINHFRAKGGAAAGDGNTDSGDGQGTNNALRVQEANAVTTWLATDPTGSGDADFLIIGDLNAYAKEDPIVAIENAGYTNLTEQFEGVGGYSYSFNGEFGHLDHALANAHLAAQVVDAATWHVNSDEPIFYDYNTDLPNNAGNKTPAQQAINVGTPYRYSDHDPVVVGVNLTSPAAITVQPVSQTTTVGNSVTFTVSVTGTPAPTFQWRKNGGDISGATGASFTISSPLVADSGTYDVVVTNALGSVTSDPFTLTVNPATATVTLGDLEQLYDGTPRDVSATTNPAGRSVTFTYDGSATAPIYPGAYEVVGTIVGPDYVGSATDTLVITTTALVRHAPAISGGLHGSLQLTTPESTSFSSSAWISGDFLVPGTPTVVPNGNSNYGGTIDAMGSATPSNYSVTLGKGTVLRHVVRRVTPVAFPVVSAPPAPTGTRDVTLNSAGQSAGDFATVRNLTVNSKAGQVVVPPGTYGILTANKTTGFTFGPTQAQPAVPAVYNLQGLTLNSGSQLLVTGPVVINLANGLTLYGTVGSPTHPKWLEVNIAAGGLSLGSDFNGSVVAPSGTVAINGSATIIGSVVSDRLTINSNGAIEDAP